MADNNNNTVTIVPERKLEIPRDQFNSVMTRRFFFSNSFFIYGGEKGLYDFGPPGTAIKSNILNFWREHFILHENMLEVETTCVTPQRVFEVSGHVEKFTDFMVRNDQSKDCYRADHLLEEHLEGLLENPKLSTELRDEYTKICGQVDDYDVVQLGEMLKRFEISDPKAKKDKKKYDGVLNKGILSDPYPFNLMFKTTIGPKGTAVGYLRPELAQGIFVNFPKLLKYNNYEIPFAGATIGTAFRNEIAPKGGLVRVREFTLAEIEHFVDPEDKSHKFFHEVKDLKFTLFPRGNQTGDNLMQVITVGQAVADGIIASETLAYFMARTHLFLLGCGADATKLRFRQHLLNEKAHYSTDCWDAELLTSYGWLECVGHADRTDYDLTVHSAGSKVSMDVDVKNKVYVSKTRMTPKFNKGALGKAFRKDTQKIVKAIEAADEAKKTEYSEQLEKEGKFSVEAEGSVFEVEKAMCTFSLVTKKELVGRGSYLPHVIEPSFGIGRIIYSILEHNFWVRSKDDPKIRMTAKEVIEMLKKLSPSEQANFDRYVMSVPVALAPVTCILVPLMSKPLFVDQINQIGSLLRDNKINFKADISKSAAIGRKYSRADEVGIPFGCTVDGETKDDKSVTLRERDSTEQIRLPIVDLPATLQKLVSGVWTWEDAKKKFPLFEKK